MFLCVCVWGKGCCCCFWLILHACVRSFSLTTHISSSPRHDLVITKQTFPLSVDSEISESKHTEVQALHLIRARLPSFLPSFFQSFIPSPFHPLWPHLSTSCPSRPPVSSPVPSPPLFFWVLFIRMFLIGPAGLSTMSNRALAGTDPDALHAFPTPAGSVVTVALTGVGFIENPLQ